MFSREDTRKVKGAAILLMLEHHLWEFSARLPTDMQLKLSGIMVADNELLYVLGMFGRVCVGLYAFLGGYGLWKKQAEGRQYSLSDDIIRIYEELWKVAVIFIPLGLLLFSGQPDYAESAEFCHVFDGGFNIIKIVQSFLGLSMPYNGEWWFFSSYITALLLGYVFIKVNRNQNFWLDALLVVFLQIFSQRILPAVGTQEAFSWLHGDLFSRFLTYDICVCSFFMGSIFAKYNALARLRMRFDRMLPSKAARLIGSLIGAYSVMICRQFCYGEADIIYVPLIIVFLLEWIDTFQAVQKVFLVLGKYSTGMWLTHSFYCYYFYPTARMICFTRNPWISLFTLVIMSLLTAIALDGFWRFVNRAVKACSGSAPRSRRH